MVFKKFDNWLTFFFRHILFLFVILFRSFDDVVSMLCHLKNDKWPAPRCRNTPFIYRTNLKCSLIIKKCLHRLEIMIKRTESFQRKFLKNKATSFASPRKPDQFEKWSLFSNRHRRGRSRLVGFSISLFLALSAHSL